MRLLFGFLYPPEVLLDFSNRNHVVMSRIVGIEVVGILQTLDETLHHGVGNILRLN